MACGLTLTVRRGILTLFSAESIDNGDVFYYLCIALLWGGAFYALVFALVLNNPVSLSRLCADNMSINFNEIQRDAAVSVTVKICKGSFCKLS